MAYHTPQLFCGCGAMWPLDVHNNVEFMKTCVVCGSEFHVKVKIPKELISQDPSRQGKLSNGEA